MKLLSIIGARPQFIKLGSISRAIKSFNDLTGVEKIEEIVIHTGQHYDDNMNTVFFDELELNQPNYNLGINNLSQALMIGKMLESIEPILKKEKPDVVIVYGDTNSTIAGALAAKSLGQKLAHIESGLRSYNFSMPEEINRVMTDRISDYLFCPNDTSVANLEKEGFNEMKCVVKNVGDVMFDSINFYSALSDKVNLPYTLPEKYILATLHRSEILSNPVYLSEVFSALEEISIQIPIIFPLHPNTRKKLKDYNIGTNLKNIVFIDPASYLEMIYLLKKSYLVITDSGGLQKESFFLKKKALVVRNETEWSELVAHKLNILTGYTKPRILNSFDEIVASNPNFDLNFFGTGNSADLIIEELIK